MLTLAMVEEYLRHHPYGLTPGAEAQLRYTWDRYCRDTGRSGLAALDVDLVNQWIDQLRQRCKHDTVRTQRGNLLTIWRWAYEERLTDEPPLRVRRLRPIHRAPEAWTIEEIRQLIRTAEQLPRRSLYWSSLIRTGYDTALRLGDLLRLRPGDVGEVLTVVQGKVRRSVTLRVRRETLKAIEAYLGEDRPGGVIWPLWGRREAFYRAFRGLVRQARIRPGTFRWIRRTAITQLERISPGAGTQLAGHAARSTTEQWYLDVSQLLAPPLPPL